jgi:2-polyprenyl-3-methyl-5-hydroxy-6-metoxy-1,4-benzoquinol methylase
LANSYLKTPDDNELIFPLELNLCENCYHLQLSHAVNPDLLFKNYIYVSGTTKTLRDYFAWFAEFTLSWFKNNPAKTVLEIACNDGSQLKYYKDLGLKTYGIDPAENLFKISSQDHEIVCDYFTDKYVDYYRDKKIDIMVAENVFAHNSYPIDFLKACKEILHDNSLLFLQTSQADMVPNNEFDTIYHEHISFFSINSMNEISKKVGLYLIDVIKTPIHGNSNVYVFSKKNTGQDRINQILKEESSKGLHGVSTYIRYAEKCHKIISDLETRIDEFRNAGYKIIGYGAAAKGMTLLNFGNLNLDFIIDDNPLKQGLYTPGMHIPITSIDELEKYTNEKIAFIPLAWNFFEEIKNRIKTKRNNDNDVFIKYFTLEN